MSIQVNNKFLSVTVPEDLADLPQEMVILAGQSELSLPFTLALVLGALCGISLLLPGRLKKLSMLFMMASSFCMMATLMSPPDRLILTESPSELANKNWRCLKNLSTCVIGGEKLKMPNQADVELASGKLSLLLNKGQCVTLYGEDGFSICKSPALVHIRSIWQVMAENLEQPATCHATFKGIRQTVLNNITNQQTLAYLSDELRNASVRVVSFPKEMFLDCKDSLTGKTVTQKEIFERFVSEARK